MFNEVKYARMTSASLKLTNAVFCLKKSYKNLQLKTHTFVIQGLAKHLPFKILAMLFIDSCQGLIKS